MLRRAYSKASKAYPDYEKNVRQRLSELRKLEDSESDSLDASADKFAMITGALALETIEHEKQRPLEQLLYHMGRFIYIIDACDDLESDTESGSFNAVAKRFGNKTGKLSDEDKENLRTTLMHSCNLVGAAYALINPNCWSSITSNIVYLGMPEACMRVLNGTWRTRDTSRINKGNGQTL
jgi:hypothetical protein